MKLLRFAPIALLACSLSASPAFAVNKDMVQLQTQVQALQDAVARLQQANDERMGVLKDLVQQTADSVNRMSVTVNGLQKQMATSADAQSGKADQLSNQVQSLNDTMDELKARLARMEKALSDVQNQQQSINAKLDNGTPAATGMPPANAAPMDAAPAYVPPAPVTPGKKGSKPAAGTPMSQVGGGADLQPAQPVAEAAPPVSDLYQTAYADYVAAKYALAGAEFNRVIQYYPDNPLAGNANFYLGEMDYRAGKFPTAIKFYDKVLEQYPGNNKTALSHLHKGYALIAIRQEAAGARELRSLVARYPNSPEANQARVKLNGLKRAAN